MKITHVLADGTKKTDIVGHTVKNINSTYEIIERIRKRLQNEQRKNKL